MLIQPTLEKLSDMRLPGLRHAVEEQLANPQYAELSFEERFSLLIDQEWTRRQDTRQKRRLKQAGFRQRATIEDLDFSPDRGLNRSRMLQLGYRRLDPAASQRDRVRRHRRGEDLRGMRPRQGCLQGWLLRPLRAPEPPSAPAHRGAR